MKHEFHKLEERLEAKLKLHGDAHSHSQEQHELSMWEKWKDVESPNTFSFLELARDGGFSEVKELYSHSRWVSAAMLVLFVVYNIVSVIILDFGFITDPFGSAEKLGTHLEDIDKFYFSRTLTDSIASALGMKDNISPVSVIGFLELLGLFFYPDVGIFDLCLCAYKVKQSDGFKRWFSVQKIFFDILPSMSVYSAMKLLYYVVPTVLISKTNERIYAVIEARHEKKGVAVPILRLFSFFIVNVWFGFIVGFDTFLMKLRVVSAAANSATLNSTVLLSTLQFLIQVIGVVQLGTFVRKRLFVFIFAGEDGIMQDEELELMETWNSLLARRIYREYPLHKFLAIMTSFSDEDFQKLVLNEDIEKKRAEIGE